MEESIKKLKGKEKEIYELKLKKKNEYEQEIGDWVLFNRMIIEYKIFFREVLLFRVYKSNYELISSTFFIFFYDIVLKHNKPRKNVLNCKNNLFLIFL